MKYKIGDKVRVRKDLKHGNSYGGTVFVSNMNKFKNEECVITGIHSKTYNINDSGYGFSEEMLEPVDDLLEYALEKLGMTKEELENEINREKEDTTFVEKWIKDNRELRKYCQRFNSSCDGCEINKFRNKHKYKGYGDFECIDAFRYLKEKEQI